MKQLMKFSLYATAIMLLLSGTAFAQFDKKKYKSPTNFANKKSKTITPKSAPGVSIKNLISADQNKKNGATNSANNNDKKNAKVDVFGRGTGIKGVKKNPSTDKYVNLNPETAFGPEVITSFDFPQTSLIDLTKHMQKLTGINLILDKDLKGKVTIMAPSPITVGDAWKAYLTALNLNGYTMVKSGEFYKIVNARDIRYTPTKIYTGSYAPPTENYVMSILPLKNINSTEVTRSFRPFMSRYGRIIDIKQTNTIIVQDTGSNINRLKRLITFIDVPGHEETLQIMRVKHSSAQEIATLLDKILKTGKTGKFRSRNVQQQSISKIIAEPRTNSIIAMANADGGRQLRSLIAKLDVRLVNSSSGQIHVYYLQHGDAETLSKTLSTLVSGSSTKKSSSRLSKVLGGGNTSLFNNPVKITADKDNNALVITAAPTDYLTIKSVINKLDVARDQVYVEGLIMETQVSRSSTLGISIIGAYGTGNAQRGGFAGDSKIFDLLQGNIASLGGLFLGAGLGKKVTIPGPNGDLVVNSVNALITAVASNSDTNVLATPQILAMDNQEAIFEVGEEIPTIERTNTAAGSQTSVKQQKVALTLKLTPQINKVTRFVKLKIDQKVNDFSSRSLPDGLASEGIAVTTRSAVTTVRVRDRDTMAMGGLMRDKQVDTLNKVPLLGDIPILGWLFKSKTKSISKVNLLFFLTPKIMSNYGKSNAQTIKDALNRRNAHMRETLGEDDPFHTTVKGLYEKAKIQEEGPLYDQKDSDRFRKSNEGPGIQREVEKKNQTKTNSPIPGVSPDAPAQSNSADPNYRQISQKVKSQSSGLKKAKTPAHNRARQ